MFLIIIILSYLLGCASTIALLLYLYTRYVIYSPVIVHERQEEQYQAFNPLPEHERAKNSTVDAVNYLFQFLFQELKDSSRLRRYLMHKLNTEFKELKNSRTGKIFLQNIVIQSFTIGKECPVFSDIQLERQERDERNLIKGFVARLDADYKDGFAVTLDITLLFGHKCLLSIKVKRIQGHLRLEFRREPFCHWLCVFQDEPFIDFEVKSKFASGESPQLAQIITQQLRRAIKRKQTWPSYKIRCQPFFATSKISVPTEVHSPRGSNIIPGAFEIEINYCDRLSIPLAVFEKQKASAVNVFLTISINEQTCAEYLHIQRDQWKQTKIDFARPTTKFTVREVSYMDRTELLIEELEPLPPGIENVAEFRAALEDKNVFLMKMQGKEVTTRKQMQSLLKYKPSVQPEEGAAAIASAVTTAPPPATTTAATAVQEDRIHIVVGIPLLQSVRVQRVVEVATADEPEKPVVLSPTLPIRSESGASLSSPTVRHRTTIPPVKYEKSSNAVGLPATPSDPEEEQTSTPATTDTSAKPQDATAAKKAKPAKTSAHDVTLVMMNEDWLQKFGVKQTATKKADSHIDFSDSYEFQVGPSEQYLNVCLWCRRPPDGDVPKADKKLILLGYAMIPLSEIVLDAHMSYKRETQVTLNFRAPFSPKPNLNAALTDAESKKRLELSTHKGYDENLVNGFVTINIKHRPEIEAKLNPQERKEQYLANAPVLNDTCTRLREAEREQEQKKYINVINEQQDSPPRKPTDHIFEDKAFTLVTQCASCHKKIWMKSGRQCRDCLVTIHRKCEEKFSGENICTHEPSHAKPIQISTPSEDDSKNFVNVELSTASAVPPSTHAVDNIESVSIKNNYELVSMPNSAVARAALNTPNTAHRLSTKAAAAFSALDSTARRSFRGAFGNKNVQPPTVSLAPSLSATSELSKSDESLSSTASGVTKKPTANNSPAQTSSKLASAASSAYSKLREYKSRRLAAAGDANAVKKMPSSLDSVSNENIPEADLRDIITKYLSDESNDVQGLEHLLHERAVDDTVLYAKAREFGQELFLELTLEERKQKLDSEISRLQHEIDLQCQIREEMFHEVENVDIDDNEKRKLRARISNVDEKIQALGALTILYCSGLKHCRAQMGGKGDVNNQSNSELPDGDDQVHFDVHRDDDMDEQS